MFYLGSIIASGATGSFGNNHVTPTAFNIPVGPGSLYLQSDTLGVQFEFGGTTGFTTSAARGAFMLDQSLVGGIMGPFKNVNPITVAIFNPITAGTVTVRVYKGPA